MWRTISIFLLVVQSQIHGADCAILAERRAGGVLDATLLLSSGTLTEEAARTCFERYASALPAKPSLLSVKMLSERKDASLVQALVDKCRTFGECRDALRAAPLPTGVLAEVLQSTTGAVMRYRSASGTTRNIVFGGTDPRRLQFGNSSFDILLLTVSAPTPLYRDRPYEGRRVKLYLQSRHALQEPDCMALVEQLSQNLDAPWTWIEVRSDPFFMDLLAYPYTLLFADRSQLPDEQTYAKSEQLSCQMMYGRAGCITSVGGQIK